MQFFLGGRGEVQIRCIMGGVQVAYFQVGRKILSKHQQPLNNCNNMQPG